MTTLTTLTTWHTVPAQKSNIIKKIIGGSSSTFSFLKIIRRLLLFARLSYYFTPVLGSQSLPRSSRLPFWPAGFILPPIIENLLIYFFQYGPIGGGVCRDFFCKSVFYQFSWVDSIPKKTRIWNGWFWTPAPFSNMPIASRNNSSQGLILIGPVLLPILLWIEGSFRYLEQNWFYCLVTGVSIGPFQLR